MNRKTFRAIIVVVCLALVGGVTNLFTHFYISQELDTTADLPKDANRTLIMGELGVSNEAIMVYDKPRGVFSSTDDQSPAVGGVGNYATNVSITGLLTATNNIRKQNGKSPLVLNGQLGESASLKAKDMINKNYWAHVAPDGKQPWFWFEKVRYSYGSAGENLAYGFDSSSQVIRSWFDSPTHKANLLGDYTEVGFGIENGYFQGTKNTVIVAHYGKK